MSYGLKVVGPAGTVIIDGTSEMYRISASGTLSLTGCNGTGTVCVANTTVDLATGFTYSPAHLSHVELALDGAARNLPRVEAQIHSAVSNYGVVTDIMDVRTTVVDTNKTRVTAAWSAFNTNRSGNTHIFRYRVLEQVGI